MSDMHIHRYRFLHEASLHLLNEFELDVRLMVAYRSLRLDCEFVYLESSPLEPSGMSDVTSEHIERMIKTRGWASEWVGFFRGQYITETELYDGYATIDGEVVKVGLEAEGRMRPMSDFNLIVGPLESRVNNIDFDQQFEELCNQLLAKTADLNQFVEFVERLPRRSEQIHS